MAPKPLVTMTKKVTVLTSRKAHNTFIEKYSLKMLALLGAAAVEEDVSSSTVYLDVKYGQRLSKRNNNVIKEDLKKKSPSQICLNIKLSSSLLFFLFDARKIMSKKLNSGK